MTPPIKLDPNRALNDQPVPETHSFSAKCPIGAYTRPGDKITKTNEGLIEDSVRIEDYYGRFVGLLSPNGSFMTNRTKKGSSEPSSNAAPSTYERPSARVGVSCDPNDVNQWLKAINKNGGEIRVPGKPADDSDIVVGDDAPVAKKVKSKTDNNDDKVAANKHSTKKRSASKKGRKTDKTGQKQANEIKELEDQLKEADRAIATNQKKIDLINGYFKDRYGFTPDEAEQVVTTTIGQLYDAVSGFGKKVIKELS